MQSHSEVLEVRTPTYELGRRENSIQSITESKRTQHVMDSSGNMVT